MGKVRAFIVITCHFPGMKALAHSSWCRAMTYHSIQRTGGGGCVVPSLLHPV